MAGLLMGGPSRDTLAALQARFAVLTDRAEQADIGRIAEELEAVTSLLSREPALRRHLVDWSVSGEARRGLARTFLGGRVSAEVRELVEAAVGGRWSRPGDLTDAIELLSRLAVFAVAERDGSLDEVEDELFRFGRILAGQPRLRTLLADPAATPERRIGLLDSVLGDKVVAVTARLLRQTVAAPRGRNLEDAVAGLSELAATRRERYLAHVRTAQPLTAAQEQHLSTTLTRIYGRPISLQIEIDDAVLGGLVVRVGEEIIDGSVAGRLAAVRHRFAG
ncbi:MAG: F0F1 ATP synthase subunit delta [Actinobacteria bacterium]|nr:F0F1 ATP synthase subunit delta [Actinomycetota bacterium]